MCADFSFSKLITSKSKQATALLLPARDDCKEKCLTEACAFCQAFLRLILSTYLGAGEGNRTLTASLGSWSTATMQHLLMMWKLL